jgi:hypothetical protein
LNNRTNKTKEKLLQEELYKKLWNYNGMTQQQSYNFFMNLSYNEIKEFDI